MEANGHRRRVVITGIGAVTPLGNDVETTWTNLISGRSGAGAITHFDTAGFPVTFACEVRDFDPTEWVDRKQARRMDRFAHLVIAAARQAEKDSGLDIAEEDDRDRRRRRHRNRRAAVVPGLSDRAPRPRRRSCESVLDPRDHPEHGRRLGVDGARDARPAVLAVHGLRRVDHVHRGRAGRDPPGPGRGHALWRYRGTRDRGR